MAIVGLGTDIVQIDRMAGTKQFMALANRVLTDAELELMPPNKRAGAFLAKRFAAKEAAVKALGTGIGHGIGFKQVHIEHDEFGKPLLSFTGAAALRAQVLGVSVINISISDERDYAVATVILEN